MNPQLYTEYTLTCALCRFLLSVPALFTEGTTLGANYHTCASRIKDAADKFTQKALANLVMPDGRQIRFTPEARKSIPEETLAEIR